MCANMLQVARGGGGGGWAPGSLAPTDNPPPARVSALTHSPPPIPTRVPRTASPLGASNYKPVILSIFIIERIPAIQEVEDH